MTKSKELYSEIIGIFHDMKELVRYYQGNIIALFIGIAIPTFNQNRNNQGMFLITLKGLYKYLMRVHLINKQV